jgi:hypothetical protein
MATNYTIEEAVKIIAEGKNTEAIQEIGKRFPILAVKIAALTAKAKDEIVDFIGYMPEYLTANKVNSEIKKSLTASDDEAEDETPDEKPVKPTKEKASKKKAAKEEEDDDQDDDDDVVDYTKYNGDTLIKMCKERGIYKKGMKKADLVAAMENYDENGATSEDDEEDDENPYEGKTAMELFKECKKRGIKAAPKKPAKFYVDLLLKADAEENDEDEDWGDEEEEETPKKPAKSSKKAKPAKEEVEDDEDDDDWDI